MLKYIDVMISSVHYVPHYIDMHLPQSSWLLAPVNSVVLSAGHTLQASLSSLDL